MLNCKIIQDLLPLYCDKLTSNESNEAIEEHLHNCESCTAVYESMCEQEKDDIKSTDKDIKPLKKIRRSLIFRIIAGTIICGGLLFGAFMFIFWGLIPIKSDKLKIDISYHKSPHTYTQHINGVDKEITETVEYLSFILEGDCSIIRVDNDAFYDYQDNGDIVVHDDITVYPALRLPFDNTDNSYHFTVPVKEGATLTIHCRDKELHWDLAELVEGFKKE